MALCSKTDMANAQKTYAVCEVMQLWVAGNFVSADRIQVDQIGLQRNWIESRSNLAPSANTPLVLIIFD